MPLRIGEREFTRVMSLNVHNGAIRLDQLGQPQPTIIHQGVDVEISLIPTDDDEIDNLELILNQFNALPDEPVVIYIGNDLLNRQESVLFSSAWITEIQSHRSVLDGTTFDLKFHSRTPGIATTEFTVPLPRPQLRIETVNASGSYPNYADIYRNRQPQPEPKKPKPLFIPHVSQFRRQVELNE